MVVLILARCDFPYRIEASQPLVKRDPANDGYVVFDTEFLRGILSFQGLVQDYCIGLAQQTYQLMDHCKVVSAEDGWFGYQDAEISETDTFGDKTATSGRSIYDSQVVAFVLEQFRNDGYT